MEPEYTDLLSKIGELEKQNQLLAKQVEILLEMMDNDYKEYTGGIEHWRELYDSVNSKYEEIANYLEFIRVGWRTEWEAEFGK